MYGVNRVCAHNILLQNQIMPYQIPLEDNHQISLEVAVDMTTLYRENMQEILKDEYQNEGILANCETFSLSVLDSLQKIPDVAAFRIYYGMSTDLKIHAILVGVDANGNDILPSENSEEEGGEIFEEGQRCPTFCPPPSPLNGE